jgi:hypothetical protein
METPQSRYLSEQSRGKKEFLKEMIQTRTPELLDIKIAKFLEIQDFPNAEITNAYEEQKQQLEQLFGSHDSGLKKDMLYHGTGLLKYDGKYNQTNETTNITPILENILQEGVKTHIDPWLPEGDTDTISLADTYLYAKWYASKYMTEQTKPQWQLGDPNDFFKFFMADSFRAELSPAKIYKTIRGHISNRKKRDEINKERSQQYQNKLQEWTSSSRNDTSTETSVDDLLYGQSNIEGNYGIVICLDKQKVIYKSMPFLTAHEVRATQDATPDTIKAIGVPFAQVEQVTLLLQSKNMPDITVFALECADLHFASFDIKDVVARIE